MKKTLLILLFITLFFSNAHAFNPLVVCSGQTVAAGGGYGSTACIGFTEDGTDCDETANPDNTFAASSDYTVCRKWTATTDGIVSRVKLRFGSSLGGGDVIGVVYINDTIEATATFTTPADAWVWSNDFQSYAAADMEFDNGDTVYFCAGFDYGGTNWTIKRNADVAPNQNYHYHATLWSAVTPSSTLDVHATREFGIILEYDY